MWITLADSLCELGESPFWHPQERSLYWVDIPGRTVLRTRGDIEKEPRVERWRMPSEPGCIAPARRGGWVIALRDGIYRAREWGGALSLMAAADHDTKTMRFNDGKCDPLGRFWAGTLNEAKDKANAALFCLDARQGRTASLVRMANEATTANGLAFSPDATRMYWSDTPAHRIRAWDWDVEANTLSEPRVFKKFAGKPEDWTPETPRGYAGRPDGATVDADGNYWAAMFEGGQVLRFSPSGEQIAALAVPAQCPTMPCFGGDDLDILFVTTSREKRPAAELEARPASGQVVAMKVDARGLPVDFFDD